MNEHTRTVERRSNPFANIPFPIVVTIITSIITSLGAYYGAQQATQSALASVRTDVAVLQEHNRTVDDHLSSIDTNIGSLNSGVQTLLIHFGERTTSTIVTSK